MKTLLSLIALMAVFAVPTHAAEINFDGGDYYMTPLDIGQTGSISTDALGDEASGFKYHYATGLLPQNASIIFTYGLLGKSINGDAIGEMNGNPIAAIISEDQKTATLTFTNLLSSAAGFSSYYLLGKTCENGCTLTTRYEVVSAVPLPAALPLFGMGLVGLAALRRRKAA